MNIPNPFKLIDHALLDYVFNPIAWECEHRWGKNAAGVGTIALYISAVMCVGAAIITRDLFILLMAPMISFAQIQKRSVAQANFQNNTKTGLNRLREDGWIARVLGNSLMCLVSLLFIFHIGMAPTGDNVVDVAISWTATGFVLMLFLPFNFDSCDALPPWYCQTESESV